MVRLVKGARGDMSLIWLFTKSAEIKSVSVEIGEISLSGFSPRPRNLSLVSFERGVTLLT